MIFLMREIDPKNENDNIRFNLKNFFQSNKSKIIKIIDKKEISLISFNSTLKQNTLTKSKYSLYMVNGKNGKINPLIKFIFFVEK